MNSAFSEYVVVIGAGYHQVPLIKHLRNRNYGVIAVDINPHAAGLTLAEVPLVQSAHDTDAVLRSLRRLDKEIVGVVTKAARRSIVTTACVARHFGVPGLAPDSAALSIDRVRMRHLLAERNLGSIPFRVAHDLQEAYSAFDELDSPVVVKPLDMSGSSGLTVVHERKSVEEAFEYAQSVSSCSTVLVERFIEGPDLGVLYVAQPGTLSPVVVIDRFVADGVHCLPDRWTLPSRLPKGIQEDAIALGIRVIEAIELNLGSICIEMKLDALRGSLHVIEVEPSMPSRISEVLVPSALGIDYVGMVADCFLPNANDKPLIIPKEPVAFAGCAFIYAMPGEILGLSGLAAPKSTPYITRIDVLPSEHGVITQKDMGSVVADIYACAPEGLALDKALATAKRSISVNYVRNVG